MPKRGILFITEIPRSTHPHRDHPATLRIRATNAMKSRCAVIITDSAGRQVYGLHSDEADRLIKEGREVPFTVLGIPYKVQILVDETPPAWIDWAPLWIVRLWSRRRQAQLQL